jgi:hypothetical protein
MLDLSMPTSMHSTHFSFFTCCWFLFHRNVCVHLRIPRNENLSILKRSWNLNPYTHIHTHSSYCLAQFIMYKVTDIQIITCVYTHKHTHTHTHTHIYIYIYIYKVSYNIRVLYANNLQYTVQCVSNFLNFV